MTRAIEDIVKMLEEEFKLHGMDYRGGVSRKEILTIAKEMDAQFEVGETHATAAVVGYLVAKDML